jgi:hypothetical protein
MTTVRPVRQLRPETYTHLYVAVLKYARAVSDTGSELRRGKASAMDQHDHSDPREERHPLAGHGATAIGSGQPHEDSFSVEWQMPLAIPRGDRTVVVDVRDIAIAEDAEVESSGSLHPARRSGTSW